MQQHQHFVQSDQHLVQESEIDRELQRILKPSQSTQNILQQQFQSRIQSIEQCLTSRTNFLIMFQQMLQQQLKQNNHNASIQSNQHNSNDDQLNQTQVYQINQIDQTRRIDKIDNPDVQQRQRREHQLLQQELRVYQKLNINNLINQVKDINIKKVQIQDIVQSNSSQQLQQQPLPKMLTNNSQQIQTVNIHTQTKPSIKSYNTKSIFSLKNIIQTIQQVRQQVQKVRYYINSSFQFLKSYIIREIFQSNLNQIVQIIHNTYSLKYQQWTKSITSLNHRIKYQHQQQINKLNQKHQEQINKLNQQHQEQVYQLKEIIKQKEQQLSKYQQLHKNNLYSKFNNKLTNINIDDFDSSLQLQSIIKPQHKNGQKLINNIYDGDSKINASSNLSLCNNYQLFNEDQHNNYQTSNNQSISSNNQFNLTTNNNIQTKQCQMSSSLIKTLKYLNFTINLPYQLPTIHSIIPQQYTQQRQFITINQKLFSYKGYIISNEFTSSGTLQFKDLNITYQGQFTNHTLNGKGKLTINLSNNTKVNSNQYDINQNKQNIPFKTVKNTNKQTNTNTNTKPKHIIIIGKFINNSLQGYAKLTLIEQFILPVNNKNQNNQKINTQSNTIFTLWKNNKIIKTL